jgi:hypothetical protein
MADVFSIGSIEPSGNFIAYRFIIFTNLNTQTEEMKVEGSFYTLFSTYFWYSYADGKFENAYQRTFVQIQ